MEQNGSNDLIAGINKMTVWLNLLVGLISLAILIMIIGGAFFVRTYTSGPMTEAAQSINNKGVSYFLVGLAFLIVLSVMTIVIAIIRSKTIKMVATTEPSMDYKKVSKMWVIIPILLGGYLAWVFLLASLISV